MVQGYCVHMNVWSWLVEDEFALEINKLNNHSTKVDGRAVTQKPRFYAIVP